VLCFLAAASLLVALDGCAKTKTLHCDKCNEEIAVKEKSGMNEEWDSSAIGKRSFCI